MQLKSNKNTTTDDSSDYDNSFKFYKSSIAGLSIQIGDEPERDEQPTEVRFTSYQEKNEKTGDSIRVGYLATDEADAIEVLADDPNVTEIEKDEFNKATQNGVRAKQ